MKVVIYARYSSNRQDENTIEAQLRSCYDYCKKNDMEVVKEYIDRATSASSHIEKRVEFLKMIKDSEKKIFQGVVVFKLDRFARNRYDSATYKNRLKKNGVFVYSATENINENKESIILESVLEGMAEYFSKDLAEKVTSGMREKAYKCIFMGGVVPLGYAIVDGKYAIDPIKSKYVIEAFTRYAKGEMIMSIVDDFNRRGIKTNRGQTFKKNSFQNIFKNEHYLGVYTFQDIRIENGIPQLIDNDTWKKVQDRLNWNKKRYGSDIEKQTKGTDTFLLSMKILCDSCNSFLVGTSGTSKNGNTYYYYKCKNNCFPPIRKDKIENIVLEHIVEILNPEIIDKIADYIMEIVNHYNNTLDNTKRIESEIKDLNKQIDNLVVALSNYQSNSIILKLKELEQNKKALEKQLNSANKDKIPLEKDMIIFYMENLINGEIDSENARKRLVDLLLEKVVIKNDNSLELYYNLEKVCLPSKLKCSFVQ